MNHTDISPGPDRGEDPTEKTVLGPVPAAGNKESDSTEKKNSTGPGDEGTDKALTSGGQESVARATMSPVDSSDTDVKGKPAETGHAALLGPDQETFMPEASLGPAPVARPPQGYPSLPGYEIVGTLGRGGMGVVYKARHRGLRRLVALKMILHGDHADASDLARFRIEAESIARLQHPNIVQIYEIGDFKGLPFFSLEFVEGGTLSRKIDDMPQPISQAALMVEMLARAMAFAHQRGIVHRDLKPGNVLLSADGTPKIVDFGLAKKLDELSGQTHSGAIMGTPSYMAPEQADGRIREIGPAADIYALGAILYDMLTGRPPFRAESPMDTIRMVIEEEPVPPERLNPRVPRDLETICLKCLHKEIAKRYASAHELAQDLRRFLEGAPISARPVTRTERFVKWVRRRPALAAVYGLFLVAIFLGALGAIMAWRLKEADTERQRELEAKRKIEAALVREQLALKGEAKANERLEQHSYIHRINLAWRDWNDGEVGRARKLIEGCAPKRRQWEWHYLQRQVFPELLTVAENHDEPLQILFTPDGKGLLILDKDNEVRERDASTGKEFPSILQGAQVQYLTYSADGRQLAAAGADQTVTIWDVAARKKIHALRGHKEAVVHLAFSPDGSRLASASWDKTAKIWDVATGTHLQTLQGHGGEVAWVAFSPDGRRLATASWDTTAKIWDLATGKEVTPLLGHVEALTQVVYSSDGRRLATACVDKTVKLWDAATFRELPSLLGPMEDINQVAFSPDGSRLALAKRDKTLKVFDVFSGKQLFFLQGHSGEVTQVSYSPDGWRVASAGNDKTVKVWDATMGRETLSLQGNIDNVNHLAYSPDGQGKVAVCVDKTVRIWDALTGRELAACAGHAEEVVHLAYSPNGQRLATASKDKTIKIWEVTTGTALHTLQGHTAEVTHVAYSPDGTRLISGGLDRIVKVWDALTAKELFSFKGLAGEVQQLALHPKGGQLAVGTKGPQVHVFDLVAGKPLFVLPCGAEEVLALAYNPAGTQLASAAMNHTVKLWDAASGKEIFSLPGHVRAVVHLAFSFDGRWLATASLDKTIKLWDARTGKHRFTLEGHNGEAVHVAFSPDSERLASASWDRTVKIWDVATGKELLSLSGHTLEVINVTFSPEGGQLASTSRGAVRIWESKGPDAMEVWNLRRHLWREEQAIAAFDDRHWFAAAFHFDRLLRHHPKNLAWRLRRGNAYAELARWDKAVVDFTVLADQAPPDPWVCRRLGLIYLAQQDQAAYGRVCAALLQNFAKTAKGKVAHAMAALAVLTPSPAKYDPGPRELALRAHQSAPSNADYESTLGAVLYRAADYPTALKHLNHAAELFGNDGSVETRLFLAMTQHHLKNPDEARRWLTLAVDQIEQDAHNSDVPPGVTPLSWEEKVRRQVLRREAERVLEKK